MKLWIARDKNEKIFLYREEPMKSEKHEMFGGRPLMNLPKEEYPEVTWDNSPQQVELKLCEIIH